MTITFTPNSSPSFKDIQNNLIDVRLARKSDQLSSELSILRNRDQNIETRITEKSTNTAFTNLDDLIAKSIEEILSIREQRGILDPEGYNKPLEELLRLDKGFSFDRDI